VQDEIAAEVVAQIDPEILADRSEAQLQPIENRRHGLRSHVAVDPSDERFERDGFRQAGDYLAQAISLEPIMRPRTPGMPTGTSFLLVRIGPSTRLKR